VAKKRRLILLNGRWSEFNHRSHIYICAYSKADAARILQELGGGTEGMWLREINEYFSVGCWGNLMDGVARERGAWVIGDHERPVGWWAVRRVF
jgi:hypothetical protein